MSVFVSYIFNFAPILVGILIFYFIKSFNLLKRRIRIYYNAKETLERKGEPKTKFDKGQTLTRKVAFDLYIREVMIINGLFTQGKGNYSKTAFSVFGVLDGKEIQSLPVYLSKCKAESVKLFLLESGELRKALLPFSPASGILLGYLAGYKLDASVV